MKSSGGNYGPDGKVLNEKELLRTLDIKANARDCLLNKQVVIGHDLLRQLSKYREYADALKGIVEHMGLIDKWSTLTGEQIVAEIKKKEDQQLSSIQFD
jgi:hypothetical protein